MLEIKNRTVAIKKYISTFILENTKSRIQIRLKLSIKNGFNDCYWLALSVLLTELAKEVPMEHPCK